MPGPCPGIAPMTKSDHLRRSRIAAGFGLALLIVLVETVHVHRMMPSPHSPLLWTVLGTVSAVLLAYAAWAKRKSMTAPDD